MDKYHIARIIKTVKNLDTRHLLKLKTFTEIRVIAKCNKCFQTL